MADRRPPGPRQPLAPAGQAVAPPRRRGARTCSTSTPRVLEAIAGIDGAVVTDPEGRLLTFGAILRIAPEALKVARAVEGARTLAALAASYHGPVLKVSEDGFLTMFLGGRRVWEI